MDQGKFLLLFHRKHQKWLPPGGHLEKDETPPEAARREVFEETGLRIEFLRQENIWIDEWNANSIERPFSVLLERLAASEYGPAHEHIDFIYIARPIGGTLTDGKWFTLEEVQSLVPDKEVFRDTLQMVERLTEHELFV